MAIGVNIVYRISSHTEKCKYNRSKGMGINSEEYKDCNEKLAIVCDNGHPIYKTLNSVRVGKGCIDCYNLRRGDTLRLTLDDYHAVAAHQGFNFIDVLPKNNEENVLWQCDITIYGKHLFIM